MVKDAADLMVSEYKQVEAACLQEYGPKTVLVFQCGTFLEIYGEHVPDIDAKEDVYTNWLEPNISDVVRLINSAGFQSSKFVDPVTNISHCYWTTGIPTRGDTNKTNMRTLAEHGYTVVVWMECGKDNNGVAIRKVDHIISAGNVAAILDAPPATTSTSTATPTTSNNVCIWMSYYPATTNADGRIKFGTAVIDTMTGTSSVHEYEAIAGVGNDDNSAYDELANVLDIAYPRELILIHNLPRNDAASCKMIDELKRYVGLTGSGPLRNCVTHVIGLVADNTKQAEWATKAAKQNYQDQMLLKFYPHLTPMMRRNYFLNEAATPAFIYLLHFVSDRKASLVANIAEPLHETHSQHMILANHSLVQLGILEDSSQATGKFGSVLRLLNDCDTPMGCRQFDYDLLHPIAAGPDAATKLNHRYDTTTMLMQDSAKPLLELCHATLPTFCDFSAASRRITNHRIAPALIAKLHANISDTLRIAAIVPATVWTDMTQLQQAATLWLSFIDKFIDLPAARTVKASAVSYGREDEYERNFLRAGNFPTLDSTASLYDCANARLDAIVDYLNEQFRNHPRCTGSGNVNAPFSLTDIRLNRKQIDALPEEERCDSRIEVNATRARCQTFETFVNTSRPRTNVRLLRDNPRHAFDFTVGEKILEYGGSKSAAIASVSNAEIDGICRIKAMQRFLMRPLLAKAYAEVVAAMQSPDMLKALQCLADFVTAVDVATCRANLARKYAYCRPVIVDAGAAAEGTATAAATTDTPRSFIKATKMRHALLERTMAEDNYIANDIELGTPSATGVLLYGINMVGKTVYIKAAGIAVIMAQAGLFVPAETFEFRPYSAIFTRILGIDNMHRGMSTFAMEMIELRTIIRMANATSLIIGDELCSGTETPSAVGIFMSGLYHLYYRSQSSFIFATHLHEIADKMHHPELAAILDEMTGLRLKHMSVSHDRVTGRLVYDRKLRDGPGPTTYGLEVCDYLRFPREFLEMGWKCRGHFEGAAAMTAGNILAQPVSRYNARKLAHGMCEGCRLVPSTEIHHITPQEFADPVTGFVIGQGGAPHHIHHAANLRALCEDCHKREHDQMRDSPTDQPAAKHAKISR